MILKFYFSGFCENTTDRKLGKDLFWMKEGNDTLMMTFHFSSSLVCNTLTFSVGAEFIGVFIYE